MSKLEELIQQYCPYGVEYKTISELCIPLKKGTLKQTELIEDGEYPVINSGRGVYGFYHSFNNEGNALTLAARGEYAGFINYFDSRFWAGGLCYPYRAKNENEILTKFIYYWLKSKENIIMHSLVAEGSIPALNKSDIDKFEVPLPALPVQREIVRILDEFSLLSAELAAELAARKQQYHYYCDELFTPKEGWKECCLSDLGTLTRGKRFVKADAVENGIPCIHYGELYTHYGVKAYKVKSHIREDIPKKLRYAKKNDVIIVGAGENDLDIGVGVAWLGEEEVAVHDACYTFSHNQNPLYISYYLRTTDYHQQIKKYVASGKICAISAEGIGKSIIHIPSIEEQDKIANQLSFFDSLVNNISEGIPAEIETRQKQYEYYRDKLLSFKRIDV